MESKNTSKNVNKKYDDTEDFEIKKVAYFKNNSQSLLLIILIILFALTLFCSFYYIGRYYATKKKIEDNLEVIEVNNAKSSSLITNSNIIDYTTTESEMENEEKVIESISTLEILTKKGSTANGELIYSVKYAITRNEYPFNLIATNDSSVLVRFSYSYDLKDWTYINNIITTSDINLGVVMSNYYDLAGVNSTVNVSTNNKIESKPGERKKIYWRSETLIRNRWDNLNKGITANLKIEYKESA